MLKACQGESQPLYDEFGGILLLILTFRYRLNLSPAELGARDSSSFVHRLVESNSAHQKMDELDERMSKHLGDWISALFIAPHLSDELTSSCSPQEYYSLVPALFNQSLEACESGKLTLENLKSGFECWSFVRETMIGADENRSAGAFLASISGNCYCLADPQYLGIE
jgi:mediator of RNA polymerase II transcription subunit 5